MLSSESDTEEEVENREATQESKEPTVDRDVLKQVRKNEKGERKRRMEREREYIIIYFRIKMKEAAGNKTINNFVSQMTIFANSLVCQVEGTNYCEISSDKKEEQKLKR